MKAKLYDKINILSNRFSINFYKKYTDIQIILPFYHSVTNNPKPHLSEIGYYRTTDSFLDDIIFLNKYYKSTDIYNLNQPNSFHISFDDGLSEIFTEAASILLKNNLHATIFINSDFVDNKNMFYRHKISLILNNLKNSDYGKNLICAAFELEMDEVLNFVDGLSDLDKIQRIASLLSIDFDDYLFQNKPYLTTNQLLHLKKMGFTIGNHSKNHPNFKNISFDSQKFQIEEVNKFLHQILGINNFLFSFPFGDENISNDLFEWMYSTGNIEYSFGVSGMKKDHFIKHKHRIPMEYEQLTAENIIKFEYFYYILKSFIGKNKIIR